MQCQLIIIFEKLIGPPHLIANVTFVMVLVQMFVQFDNVVEAQGSTEFAERMAGEAGLISVSFGLMRFEACGCEAREFGDEVSFVFDAEVAEGHVVVGAEVGFEGGEAGQSFFDFSVGWFVVIVIVVVVIVVGIVSIHFFFLLLIHVNIGAIHKSAPGQTTRMPKQRQHHPLVIILLKMHPHILLVHESASQLVAPNLVLTKALVMHVLPILGIVLDDLEGVLVDNERVVGGFADGAFGVVVEMAEAEVAGGADVVVAAGGDGALVGEGGGVADEAVGVAGSFGKGCGCGCGCSGRIRCVVSSCAIVDVILTEVIVIVVVIVVVVVVAEFVIGSNGSRARNHAIGTGLLVAKVFGASTCKVRGSSVIGISHSAIVVVVVVVVVIARATMSASSSSAATTATASPSASSSAWLAIVTTVIAAVAGWGTFRTHWFLFFKCRTLVTRIIIYCSI